MPSSGSSKPPIAGRSQDDTAGKRLEVGVLRVVFWMKVLNLAYVLTYSVPINEP